MGLLYGCYSRMYVHLDEFKNYGMRRNMDEYSMSTYMST